ncbi:MAG: PAS domain-containing protein [Chloroflexia bacterium]
MGETIAPISDERTELAALLETMGDGLLMIDHDGVIVLANSAAEHLLDPATRFATRRGAHEVRDPLVEVARDHELTGLVRDARREGAVRSALIESGGRHDSRGGRAGGGVARCGAAGAARSDRDTAVGDGAAGFRGEYLARVADAAGVGAGAGGDAGGGVRSRMSRPRGISWR